MFNYQVLLNTDLVWRFNVSVRLLFITYFNGLAICVNIVYLHALPGYAYKTEVFFLQ